jgi:hypothetical protein
MTTNRQPRRLRRQAGEGNGSGGSQPISERLRAAREARGVDLFRVERDTKIRVKYLSAMELGLFSELPADVYARGFLRNYASYLGLDPDEAESEWRRGNFAPAPKEPVFTAPAVEVRPLRPPVTKTRAVTPGPAAEGAAAPAFKIPGLKLPHVGWPTARTGDAAPAVPRQTPVTPKPWPSAPKRPPAEPSILESPPAPQRGFALGVPAFLRRHEKEAVEPLMGGPEPIAMPGRSLVLQPIHIVLLLLVAVIAAVGLFFGVQATRVLQDPTLTVTTPDQAVYDAPIGATTFRLAGKATPKADISISWDNRAPMHAAADESGNWSFDTTLHSGNNQFEIWSTDLATTHHSQHVTRVINVPTPTASPVPMFLAVDSPTDGQAFRDGLFTVYGTTVAVTSVTVTPTYLGQAPSALPTPKSVKTAGPIPTAVPTIMPVATPTPLSSPTPTPRPTPTPNASIASMAVQVIPTIDGKFKAQMHLWSGRWKLSVVGANAQGVSTTPVELTVVVTAGSLTVLVQVKGSSGADLKIWKDGKLMAGYSPFKHFKSGQSVKIVADQSVWIFAGIPRNTFVTVNGVPYGQLGPGRDGASWRINAFGPPVVSNDR